MFSLAQFWRLLEWDFRLSSSVASSGAQECVCGSNVQIFRVVAAFVLGKKLQWNRCSKFYLHRRFFLSLFSENCQEKIFRIHKNTLVIFQIRTTCGSKLYDGKICLILFFNDDYVKTGRDFQDFFLRRKTFEICTKLQNNFKRTLYVKMESFHFGSLVLKRIYQQ